MKRLTLLLLPLLTACADAPSSQEEREAVSVEARTEREQRRQALYDSTTHYWDLMIVSDDQKLQSIQRLVQELSYVPEHDVIAVERLTQQQVALLDLRYDRLTMANSDSIDLYDAATDSLLVAVVRVAASTPGVAEGRYPLVQELMQEIRAADDSVLFYRIDYDRQAKAYNAFLQAERDVFDNEYRQVPLFELQR